jgi:hypothetical protein
LFCKQQREREKVMDSYTNNKGRRKKEKQSLIVFQIIKKIS